MFVCPFCAREFRTNKGLGTHKYRCNHRPGAACHLCHALLTDENRKGGWHPNICIHCQRKYMRDWHKAHPGKSKAYADKTKQTMSPERKLRRKHRRRRSSKKYFDKLRLKVFAAYGGKCECCGISEPMFLTIDHRFSNGMEDRKKKGIHGGRAFYFYLTKWGFPQDAYRLLCYNCNMAMGHYGFCPHQVQIELFQSRPHQRWFFDKPEHPLAAEPPAAD